MFLFQIMTIYKILKTLYCKSQKLTELILRITICQVTQLKEPTILGLSWHPRYAHLSGKLGIFSLTCRGKYSQKQSQKNTHLEIFSLENKLELTDLMTNLLAKKFKGNTRALKISNQKPIYSSEKMQIIAPNTNQNIHENSRIHVIDSNLEILNDKRTDQSFNNINLEQERQSFIDRIKKNETTSRFTLKGKRKYNKFEISNSICSFEGRDAQRLNYKAEYQPDSELNGDFQHGLEDRSDIKNFALFDLIQKRATTKQFHNSQSPKAKTANSNQIRNQKYKFNEMIQPKSRGSNLTVTILDKNNSQNSYKGSQQNKKIFSSLIIV
ncbi:UNKNOWN [Stylonychia lemnae]|uniref:Uncharacterized protein n=1 Tax=Stylonychia lemnae TaxID=5949 RepID=A0A078B1R4_STYLE|nr:UNKNOWN [Stylonychia lemnae]|eukprot:CDW87262.1 UNKNOWN [Stylonychia lemnae]